MIIGVAGKTVEHGLYLPLASVCPDRIGEEEVKFFAEHRGIEVDVRIEPGRFTRQHFRLQNILGPDFKASFVRLDSAVTSGVKKVNEPITCTQDPTADIEHFAIRSESGIQQVDELLPSGKFKVFDGNTIKLVSRQLFKLSL